MELHILIDNLPAENCPELHNEHGLSVYFTLDGKHWLADTGASGKFMHNMEQLRICTPQMCPVEEIDGVFISHGHNDHTGGLRTFIESNCRAPIWLHNSIRGNLFFSCRPRPAKPSAATDSAEGGLQATINEYRSIGMEQALFAEYGDRFREIDSPTKITEKITLIPITGERPYPTPMGNEFLYKNDLPDNFTHETVILIEHSEGKYAIISPCTHNGILNVLECCSRYMEENSSRKLSGKGEITHFIGGLHYVDYLATGEGEKETASIKETATRLKKLYPALKLYSGHCTCSTAGEILKNILGENYSTFRTGTSLQIL